MRESNRPSVAALAIISCVLQKIISVSMTEMDQQSVVVCTETVLASRRAGKQTNCGEAYYTRNVRINCRYYRKFKVYCTYS